MRHQHGLVSAEHAARAPGAPRAPVKKSHLRPAAASARARARVVCVASARAHAPPPMSCRHVEPHHTTHGHLAHHSKPHTQHSLAGGPATLEDRPVPRAVANNTPAHTTGPHSHTPNTRPPQHATTPDDVPPPPAHPARPRNTTPMPPMLSLRVHRAPIAAADGPAAHDTTDGDRARGGSGVIAGGAHRSARRAPRSVCCPTPTRRPVPCCPQRLIMTVGYARRHQRQQPGVICCGGLVLGCAGVVVGG